MTGHTYTLGGALDEETYPSGRVVKNIIDNTGDLAMVESKKNASSGLVPYAKAFSYTAAGAVSSMQLGNGRWESTTFNNRLQPTQIALGTVNSGYDLLRLDYTYGTTDNNGNVQSQTITVPTVGANTGFTALQTYNYDSLNRLKDATEASTPTGGSSADSWKQTFLYDRYGNRNFDTSVTGRTTTLGSCATAVCNPSISTSNNRITSSGYTYDASGNTVRDASDRKFTYDGENKQTKIEMLGAGTATVVGIAGVYSYDGNGRRVSKYIPDTETTVIFIYDALGRSIAEYSTNVAEALNAKVGYLTYDNLGSVRLQSDAQGGIISRNDYFPFGNEIEAVGGRSASLNYSYSELSHKFGGYETDKESSLLYSWARMFSSGLGRFNSPDPYWGSALASNPQSWNRYSYAINNATNMIDKFGLTWLRKGTEYFWVDDKDFEKNGERWHKNGDYDEVVPDGTILKVGPSDRQDNDRARGFAGKNVMLGAGNRIDEVTEDGAVIVRDSGPSEIIQIDYGNYNTIREPVLKCSLLVQNPYLRAFGAHHQWIKTNQKEVGAEKKDGDERNVGINLFNLPYMTLQACSGSSFMDGATCDIVRAVDVNIVNSELKIGQPLEGRWGYDNNCQTVVDQILNDAKKGPRPQPLPTP